VNNRSYLFISFCLVLSACTSINSQTPTNTATSTIAQPVTRTIAPTSTLNVTQTATDTPVPTITSTSTPSSTPTVTIIPPKIYSQAEAEKVDISSIPIIPNMVFLTKSMPMALGSSLWYVSTNEVLENNIKSMIWSFSVDGYSIPFENLVRKDVSGYINGGNHPGVSFYTILNNWTPGIHHAQSGWTIDKILNDGFSDYQPGDKNHLIDSTIYLFNGESKEKDYKKWPIVFQEDFENSGGYWSSWKMGKENDEISCETLEGEFVCSINTVVSRLITTRELGVISSDKYFLSIDTDIIDVSEGMSPCFGFSYNQDRNLVSTYPFNLAGICNIKGKAALTIEEYSTNATGKASDFILHEDWGKIKNISLLVNGRNVQFFVNGKKVQEKYIPGIMPGRTVGLYVEFLPGSTMHFNLDNLQLAMPVNLSDIQNMSTP
jgi:hypothetical protein